MREAIRQFRWQFGVWILALAAAAAICVQPVAATESRVAVKVQGGVDDQGTPYGFPVQIAGLDTNGKSRVPKTDANGNWVTSSGTGTSANQVQGTAADGAAAVGNPVQIGGVDGSGNAQAVLTDTSGRQGVVGASAVGAAVAGNPVLVGASDGTNANYLKVETAANPNLRAAIYAGASRLDANNTAGDGQSTSNFSLFTASLGHLLNASGTWDKERGANAASNTTGTGLPGTAVMGFDGTNYQLVKVDTAANPNLRVTLFNGANQIDNSTYSADAVGAATRGLATAALTYALNGTTADRLRTVSATPALTGVLSTAGNYSFGHLAANATTTLKSGAGLLHTVSISTKGITNTVTLYDNTAGSGTVIAIIDTTLSQDSLMFDLKFSTGLTAVVAGGTAADLTITYM